MIHSIKRHLQRRGQFNALTTLVIITGLMGTVLSSSSARAGTYYVDAAQGQDSNTGALDRPWQTVAKAQAMARPGDTINLAPGHYGTVVFDSGNSTPGTPDQWITYQSYPNPYQARFDTILFQGGGSRYTKILSLDVETLSGLYGIKLTDGVAHVNVEDCKVHGKPEAIGPGCLILIRGAHNITVEGCEVYYGGPASFAIQMDGSSTYLTVRNCHVHDIIQSGIRTDGATHVLIEGNIVHDQREDWNPEAHGSGISIHSHYTTIRGNIVYNYGNTRPIRFYQSWAGDDGYHDMIVENNLVFKTSDYQRVMWWVEFIDVGDNCVIRNNTFMKSCAIFFAKNADGSGLSLHNNVFAGGFTLDNFGTTATLRTQTREEANAKWARVQESGNFFSNLAANGNGYLCNYTRFSPTSNSIVNKSQGFFSAGSFFDSATGDYPYQLAGTSPAIGFADPATATANDLLGTVRDSAPDAGCYEFTGIAANHRPVLQAIADQSITIGVAFALTLDATDADGDSLTYAASGLPTGATFAGQTFQWTPTAAQGGAHQVTFTVSDGQLSDTRTITLTAAGPNATPRLAAIGDKSVTENANLSFSISATDADGDPITYSANPLPSGASFTGQTFTWTPNHDQAGQYAITFTASDGRDQHSELVTLTVANLNRAPTLVRIGDRSIDENTTLAFAVTGNDPDLDNLTYAADNIPAGARLTSQGFSWTPTSSQVGFYDVVFTVSDGQFQDSETVTIIVVGTGPDATPPAVTRRSPEADAIQTPLNNLVKLYISDAGEGVDADSVVIKVDDRVVYQGGTDSNLSELGRCSRSGMPHNYRYIYQPDTPFDFDHTVTVEVQAADLAGNAMTPYTYSFVTEMRVFGHNRIVADGPYQIQKSKPATVGDATGTIWTVWHTGPDGARDIAVSKQDPHANTFGASKQLTTSGADRCNPDIAMSRDGVLYVVWQDNQRGNWDIFASISSDGENWSRPVQITDSDDNEVNPAVIVDHASPSRAYVVWQDDRNGNQDIYVASSISAFADHATHPVTTDAADQIAPDITVDAQNVVSLVWTDMRNGQADIYGAHSADGLWTNTPVVTSTSVQSEPAVAAEPDASILHFLWVDNASGNDDIYYAWSDGLPDSPLVGTSIVDDTSGADQIGPAIACAGNMKVFACWEDFRHAAQRTEDSDLFVTELDTAAAKTNILIEDDGTNANQSEPAPGIDTQGNPYVVWTDDRDGSTGIYFAATTSIDPDPLDSKVVRPAEGGTIGIDPDAIARPDDVSIIVPAGACQSEVRITISRILNPQTVPAICLGSYEFGPSGIEFEQPVTVTIPYRWAEANSTALPYWYDSLTGALSQQGITDIENVAISPDLSALRFKTTHFTPFYLVSDDASGGGCSIAATGNGSPREMLVPYGIIAVVMIVLKRRDRKRQRTAGITEG